MIAIKRIIIFNFLFVARKLRQGLMKNDHLYKILFTPGYEQIRWLIGKWKAWLVLEQASQNTPAYKDFLAQHPGRLELHGWDPDFSHIAPTDKESYIKKYSIESRCVGGHIPQSGVMIDESSGTSGTPNNWIRGRQERAASKQIVQIALRHLLGSEPLFLINAFALGPWATGMNVSMSLVDITILKSTGPDIAKIENTLNFFGPKYKYLITGYPPFLKQLADSTKVKWSDYDISIIFGGEGMSEPMRAYLQKSFKKVYGSYGASDLEINIGAENDFTIKLRQFLIHNPELYKKVVRDEYGVVPMIFQYNPLDYYIETNAHGELLITLCRTANICPKIRYNIHDLGHVVRIPQLQKILKQSGLQLSDISPDHNELPLLFHYGRADMSVAFYGCKITPQDIEEIIFAQPDLAPAINSFALLITEDSAANKKLTIALELQNDRTANEFDLSTVREHVLHQLTLVNQDYRESSKMIPTDALPQVEFFLLGQGPFAANDIRLKKHYIQKQT